MLDGRWRATVERGLEPVGQGLHRAGVTADGLTIIGLVFAIGTALVIADGHLLLGVFGVILTGLPDILDGSVARQSGRAGPRGAFFDSVCDRVADAAMFIGVAWYLSETGVPSDAVLAMAVLALSMLITYERARAESLGFQARGGLMERAERLVLLGVGLAFDILVPGALDHARAHRDHRGAALRQGVAPSHTATSATHAPSPRVGHRGAACRQSGAVVGGAPPADRALFRLSLRVASSLTGTPEPEPGGDAAEARPDGRNAGAESTLVMSILPAAHARTSRTEPAKRWRGWSLPRSVRPPRGESRTSRPR